MTDRIERAEGTLLGLACGDALGRPIEFSTRHQIEQQYGYLTEMVGGGTHNKPAGTVTDDTDMALCIARSLVERDGFDPDDVASRFVDWYESGPFDIGIMTSDALRRIRNGESWETAGQAVWESKPEGSNAGNGSVMRCAPYAVAFAESPETLEEVSRQSSAITHADPRCTAGCAILNRVIAAFLTDSFESLDTVVDATVEPVPDELANAVRAVPENVSPDGLESSGYVVHTLQTALYHALTADNAKEAICEAVNMGQDTDTVGAVTGALAGARFGASSLPDSWVQELTVESTLRKLASELSEQ
jgi:ADP-ribosyl-[dinitrogen reductase] hydrolase